MKITTTIRAKLIAVAAGSTLATCAVGLVGYLGVSTLSGANEASMLATEAMRNQMEVDIRHEGLSADVHGLLLARLRKDAEAEKAVREGFPAHVREMREYFAKLQFLALPDELKTPIAESAPALAAYIGAAEAILADATATTAEARLPAFVQQFQRLEETLGQVSDKIEANARDRKDEAAKAAQRLSVGMLALIALAAPALFLFISLIARSIVTRISDLRRFMDTLASGEADLTRRLDVRNADEIGATGAAFNRFMDALQLLVRSVRGDAGALADSAARLATATAQVAAGSRAQSEAASALAASIEQMSASVDAIAQSANEVREKSEGSQAQTREGHDCMADLVGRIGSVEQSVRDISVSVRQFIGRAGSISGLTRQVKEVAEQTNLLALNAAIEAARAGEQGRGFAVVADEVRKLAERSAQCAREIDDVTASFAVQSGEVERVVGGSLDAIQRSREQSDTVAATLSAANTAGAEASRGVAEISIAVGEQSVATQTVAGNIETIAQMAEEIRASMSASAESAAAVHSLSGSLQALVERFRVAP
ncbi:MAG: methyl-accepting chemotaxis protein [Candidatus Methylophosphatis roskildensis]